MRSAKFSTARLLILDHDEDDGCELQDMLHDTGYHFVECATESQQFLSLCRTYRPDLLLMDLHAPLRTGGLIRDQLRPGFPEGCCPPILGLTTADDPASKRRALSDGVNDLLLKPYDSTEVFLRSESLLEMRYLHLHLRNQDVTLDERVSDRLAELEEAQIEILERLALAAEYRDDCTGQHTQRVGQMSALVARTMRLPGCTIALLRRAAPLHDVGKIGIPDNILLKPGRLTPLEFEQMKAHTLIGARMLSESTFPLLKEAASIALTHHERWDGSGYPHGLKGEQIPLAGRIVAVTDVWDALIHERPYKHAWSVEDAREELIRQSGRQFDPQVVEAFLHVQSTRFATRGSGATA